MDTEKFFCCSICQMTTPYTYYGKHPSDKKQIVLLEKAYTIKNPFKNKDDFLVVGGKCSKCEVTVCVDSSCSIFYCERVCRQCAVDIIASYPTAIQKEIERNFM